MRLPCRLVAAACLAAATALAMPVPAAEDSVPLPPLRPPELGGPDPVADWSDPEAPLAPSPPKPDAPTGPPAVVAAEPGPEASEPGPSDPAPTEASEHGSEAEPAGPAAAEHEAPQLDEALAEERPPFDLAEAERCEAELRRLGADFTLAEPIEDAGCGAERPLALRSLPDGIAVEGHDVRLRCEAALALARWADQVVAPSAPLHLGTAVEALVVSTSYHCRDRGGSSTPSQHAFANAIDVMGLRFADGSVMLIAPRPGSAEPLRAFQAAIRGGACAFFTTVIGPTTNEAHEDHLHLDVKRRSSGYRVCE